MSKGIDEDYTTSLSQRIFDTNTNMDLLELHKSLDEDSIRECIKYYDELFKQFEKLLKIFYYFFENTLGKKTDFSVVKDKMPHDIKRELKEHDNFKDDFEIMFDFSTIVWGAIKHAEYTINPITQVVTFKGRIGKEDKPVLLAYDEFFMSTKEIFADVFILSRFHKIFILKKLEVISQ